MLKRFGQVAHRMEIRRRDEIKRNNQPDVLHREGARLPAFGCEAVLEPGEDTVGARSLSTDVGDLIEIKTGLGGIAPIEEQTDNRFEQGFRLQR